jgi:hypothetical protein
MRVQRITSQATQLLRKHRINVVNIAYDNSLVFSVPGIKDDATSFELQYEILHVDGGTETKFAKLVIVDDVLMLDYERHAMQQKQDNVAFKVVTIKDDGIDVVAQYKGKRYKGTLLIDEE